MKKTFKLLSFTLILTLIAGVFLFTGCEKVEKDGKDNSFKAIKDKGEMVIGVDDEFAPMGFKDKDGNLVGFDIDLAKLVCKKLGVKAKIKAIPWDTKEIQLQSGDIDAIWNGYTITSERNGKSRVLKTLYEQSTNSCSFRADSRVALVRQSQKGTEGQDALHRRPQDGDDGQSPPAPDDHRGHRQDCRRFPGLR